MTDTYTGGQAALVRLLDESGLLGPSWRPAFDTVPRAAFIPDPAWRQTPDRCVPVTGADRLRLIASDLPVVTQLDDGAAGGPGIATSSNSMPSMVARQLALLDLEDGDRVLEIGTATGYVAALLCERLGDHAVHSVEVDPVLAAEAARNLRARGYAPHLVHGDGAEGWPDTDVPFDAILSTCALRTIPAPLLEQTRPGGRIVSPLVRDFGTDTVVRLVKREDGTAHGRFAGRSSYMPMRSHRALPLAHVDNHTARHTTTPLDLGLLTALGFTLYAGERLPQVRLWESWTTPGPALWAQAGDGSALTADAGAIWQYGPRDLWPEIETVHSEYVDLERPDAEQFGVTVRPETARPEVWLTQPDAVVVPMPR